MRDPEQIVTRPWGVIQTIGRPGEYVVKEIIVFPGKQCSLHVHEHHDEHWIVISGEGRIVLGRRVINVAVNSHVLLPAGLPHRVINPSQAPLRYIEMVFGSSSPEDDLQKLDCTYDL